MVFTHSLQHALIESRFFVLGWCANARSSTLTHLHVSKLKEFLTERPQSSCLPAKPLPQQTEKKLPIVVPQLELLSYRDKLVRGQHCMVACVVSISAYFMQFCINCSRRGGILQFAEKDSEKRPIQLTSRSAVVFDSNFRCPSEWISGSGFGVLFFLFIATSLHAISSSQILDICNKAS